MPTTVLVKTWLCTNPNCFYSWQFEGEAASTTPFDLTLDQLRHQFPEPQFFGLLPGKCPSCWLKGESSDLYLENDEANMAVIHVAADADLEAKQIEDTDGSGNLIMEQTGVRQELGVVDGAVAVVDVPIYEAKMRELNSDELRELKAQRDQILDKLDAIAVKEVS